MNYPNKFWMVKAEGDQNPAKFIHKDKDRAIQEALRLSKENPTVKFFILESIAFIKRTPDKIKLNTIGSKDIEIQEIVNIARKKPKKIVLKKKVQRRLI